MEQVIKNADVSVLRMFLAIFFYFFFWILRNFTKYYLHAKFQINWTIQTEITEGEGESTLPRPYQSAKSPACLGLNTSSVCKKKSVKVASQSRKSKFSIVHLNIYNF